MGNYRFRLSDMMPNAWFYKLKEIGKSKNHNTIAVTAISASHSTKKKQPTTSKPSKSNHHHHLGHPRKSYHFTRQLIPNNQRFHVSPTSSKSIHTQLPDPPRKSSKTRLLKRRPAALRCSSPRLVTSSVSADCSCRPTATSATLWTKSSDSPPDYSASSSDSFGDESSDLYEDDSFPPEFRSDHVLSTESFDKTVEWGGSCGCKVVPESIEDDIIIDVDKKSLAAKFDKLDISDLDLPPIITKPTKVDIYELDKNTRKKEITQETAKYRKITASATHQEKNAHNNGATLPVKEETMKEQHKRSSNSSVKRRSFNSPGLKLRVNSPRIAGGNRRIFQGGRKSVSSSTNSSSNLRRSLTDSLAIVKSSFDPQKDFRESMVEMIEQNNIRTSKDLEDLLACYLSLNSDEYHDLIIKVFKQIWFDLIETPSK